MVPDEHELVGEAQRTEARWQRDLGCFVYDTVVELAAKEQRAARQLCMDCFDGARTGQQRDRSQPPPAVT